MSFTALVLKRLRSFLKSRWFLAFLVLVVSGAGIALWIRSANGNYEFMTVAQGPFIESVRVAGTVVAAEETDMGFAESGRVSAVYVKAGERVSAGTLLAAVENGDRRAQVGQKSAALAREEAKLASLEAGTRPEEIAIAEAGVDSAAVALAQAAAAVVDSVRGAYAKSDEVVQTNADQFIEAPHSSSPRLAFTTTNTALTQAVESGRVQMETLLTAWKAESSSLTASGDLEAAVAAAQQNLASVSVFLADATSALGHAIPSTSVPQSAIDDYASDIAGARTSVNAAATALTTAVTAYKNASTALVTAERNLELKKAGTTKEDLDAQRSEVAAARAELQSARAALQKTLIVAPFSGIVAKNNAKVGETASPGMPLVTLLSGGLFEIEVYVPEISIARVAEDNTAVVTLDAYGEAATFTARVISIDPAETTKNGVATYKTVLEFSEADPRIRSGMTANVTITTGTRENALVVPSGVVVNRGEEQFVLLLRGRTVVRAPVTVGAVNAFGQTEILSGLSAGDVIVLNP